MAQAAYQFDKSYASSYLIISISWCANLFWTTFCTFLGVEAIKFFSFYKVWSIVNDIMSFQVGIIELGLKVKNLSVKHKLRIPSWKLWNLFLFQPSFSVPVIKVDIKTGHNSGTVIGVRKTEPVQKVFFLNFDITSFCALLWLH